MKNQSILYTLVFLLVSGLGATAAVEYEGYTNPAGDKFPIAVYDNISIKATKNGVPLTEAEQKAYFDTLRLAGFNVELWEKGSINDTVTLNKWASYLKQMGMGTILDIRGYTLIRNDVPGDASTPESTLFNGNWEALHRVMRNHSNNPYVWGFCVADEPQMLNLHTPVWQMTPGQSATLATFDVVNSGKGQKVAYANFVADVSRKILGEFYTDDPQHPNPDIYVPNFECFLDHMVDTFGLKFLTFDLYPVISHSEGPEPVWAIKRHYYNFMDLYGRYCRDKKIPVWLVMLSVEHSCYNSNGNLDWEYPEITEGLLRLQAMNGLAFGMKGLAYWRYGSHGEWVNDLLYKGALYDGNKMATTPAWEAARRVNHEISQYGARLQNATYDKSCIAVNDTANRFDQFEELSGSFYDVYLKKHTGYAVLLSHLTSDNFEYVAIVNQDHINPQGVTLTLPLKYERVMTHSLAASNASNQIDGDLSQTKSFVLAPGDMLLFRRNK